MSRSEAATVRTSFRVAARAWRSHFWIVTALLAILPAAWQAPSVLLAGSGVLPTGRISELAIRLAETIWWSPLLAGQVTFCLALLRSGTATSGSFLLGLHKTPRIILFWILLDGALEAVGLVPTSSGDDLQWSDGLSMALLAGVLFGAIRFAFAPTLIADMDLGIIAALRRSWLLTQGRTWLIARFSALMLVATAIIYFAVGRQKEVTTLVCSLLTGPLLSLAYVALYLSVANHSLERAGVAVQPDVATAGVSPRR